MPQRPDFDITADSLISVMDTLGVLEIGDDEKVAILGAYYDQNPEFVGLYVVLAESGVSYFDVTLDKVDAVGFTGSFLFLSDGTTHVIRKLQTADGEWMSEYKTELPIEVLSRMVISSASDTIEDLVSVNLPTDLPEFEAMYAYYDEQSLNVASLVYMSSYGIYARADGNWVVEDVSVPSYQNLMTVEIAPEKADELIQMFDDNFGSVSLKTVKAYENVELEGESTVE